MGTCAAERFNALGRLNEYVIRRDLHTSSRELPRPAGYTESPIMMVMSYFSDRHGGARPRTVEDVVEVVAAAVIGMINTRIADCSFAQAYPSTCFEYDAAVVATDEA